MVADRSTFLIWVNGFASEVSAVEQIQLLVRNLCGLSDKDNDDIVG